MEYEWVGEDTGVFKLISADVQVGRSGYRSVQVGRGMQWCDYIGVQVDRGGYRGMSQSVLSPHRIGVYTSILDFVLEWFPGSISMHMWRPTNRNTHTHTHTSLL